jgi:hypothetical protein
MFKIKHIDSLFYLTLIFLYMNSCGLLSDSYDAITGATGMLTSEGNSPFHRSDEKSLETGSLEIAGEVADPGLVNLTDHYKREIIIKDARPAGGMDVRFKGAYRYRGYSLFDILHPFVIQKKNIEEFRPATDLYIIIENETGSKAVFSWSEIFHTNILHQVIIATEVAPVESYRQDGEFETCEKWMVVCGTDLFSYRTLENPVKIEIRSFDKKTYVVDRDMDTRHSPSITVIAGNDVTFTISKNEKADNISYYSIFYGMGMGYHSVSTFQGPPLDFFIGDKLHLFDEQWNNWGLVCFAGIDGYRAIYSFSELFNRADQVRPILAVSDNNPDDGYYRIFHPASFYADRSVKSLSEIFFFKE